MQKCQEEPSPEDQDDSKCDATGSKEEMKNVMKDVCKQALEEEELELEKVRGEAFIGNRHGLGFTGLMECVHKLEQRDVLKDRKITSLEDKANSLEDQLYTLKISIQEYSLVRNAFISIFKRDKLNNVTELDIDIIRKGNRMVHGGDAVMDALLYEGLNGRRDSSTFKELYGIHPADVVKITHKETSNILNIHARVRADSYKTGTDKFYQRFSEFVQLFEGSDYDESYLTAGSQSADVACAYWSLLGCQRYQDST
ncbi:hypothetical protein L873DRAFT_1794718 [Choiromyces venosus 120613-1]|uniref:Uncharacterized protein n=1 Tax=Choiromyces venosus 120613-1 TaxID=1336337 RepID=A0A3N4JD71_9PEZI|nr:hypothetical protein L873DRAFT_1794718 [Choiromyces venosus 120613-1]